MHRKGDAAMQRGRGGDAAGPSDGMAEMQHAAGKGGNSEGR